MGRLSDLPASLLNAAMPGHADLMVRPMRADDLESLINACAPEDSEARFGARWIRALHNAERVRGLPVIALDGGSPVGHAQLLLTSYGAEIADVGVAPAWQGQGIGSFLVRTLLAVARYLELERVEIGVDAGNERALALYQRLGFRTCRRIIVPGAKEPAWILELIFAEAVKDVAQ